MTHITREPIRFRSIEAISSFGEGHATGKIVITFCDWRSDLPAVQQAHRAAGVSARLREGMGRRSSATR